MVHGAGWHKPVSSNSTDFIRLKELLSYCVHSSGCGKDSQYMKIVKVALQHAYCCLLLMHPASG